MKLFILANPDAGSQEAEKVMRFIADSYPNLLIIPFFTRKKDDEFGKVQEILRQFQSHQDKLLILGGDGTLSKVLTFLPPNIPFAYYPTGSGNDFARSLKITNLNQIIDSLLVDSVKEIYVLKSNLGIVVNSLDIGYTAQIVAYSEHSYLKKILNKIKLGRLTYMCFGVLSLFKKAQFSLNLVVDGQEMLLTDLFFLSLANNTYFGGGIVIWPDSTAYKSEIDLIWFKGGHLIHRVRALLDVVLNRHRQSRYLYHLSCQEVNIQMSETSFLQLDGELTQANHVYLTCHKRFIYV